MHVINRDNMKIVSTIKTGFGSARTTFIPKRGLAIVTNTKDSFVTVIDTKTHKKIKDVDVTSRVTNTSSALNWFKGNRNFPLHGVRNNRRNGCKHPF
jgi:DNA-binding beta-propeller fold protein YncE